MYICSFIIASSLALYWRCMFEVRGRKTHTSHVTRTQNVKGEEGKQVNTRFLLLKKHTLS